MSIYFGVNIILFAKRLGRIIIANNVFRHIFEHNSDIDAIKLHISNILSNNIKYKIVKIIHNYNYIKGHPSYSYPTVLVQIHYNDMYRKFDEIDITDIFPYLYEYTPFEETYKSTSFYKNLYIHKMDYPVGNKMVNNLNAKALFANIIFLNSIDDINQ